MIEMNRFLALVLVVACAGVEAGDLPKIVPLTKILASPEEHARMRVSTMGVLDVAGDHRLCLNIESVERHVWLNCIPLRGTFRIGENFESLAGKYVQVIGYVDTSSPLPRGYGAILRDIEVLRPIGAKGRTKGGGGN